jgi:hypothetical protein
MAAGAITPGVTAQRSRRMRLCLAAGTVAALLPFFWFDADHRQVGVFASWLTAMVLYLLQWPRPRGLLRWRPSRWLLAALAAYALGLFVIFCLIYDNWRWASTGDSLYFYMLGEDLVRGNPARNWLSVRGVFEQYTVVQTTLQSVFMHLSLTLFAHRLGNAFTSTLLVIAASLFAGLTSGATAAVLVGLFLPVQYVFAAYTMLSYPNLTGVLPYYAAYVLFCTAWTRWESDFLWAALGLMCGLAIYFPPVWVGAVGLVSAGVVLSAVYWRTPRVLLVWAGAAVVAALPALLQVRTLMNFWRIVRPTAGLTRAYVIEMISESLRLMTSSYPAGAKQPWVLPPFGYLFYAGVALALWSGVLALLHRPRARALSHAWVWPLLFAGDVIGLSLMNSGYPTISVKRAMVLLPNITFLLVLPLAWLAERVGRTWFTVALTLATLAPYAYVNAVSFWWVNDFSFNVADGIVHITQTAPGKILLVTADKNLHKTYNPQSAEDFQAADLLQRMFRVRDRLTVTATVPEQRTEFDRVVCFSQAVDGAEWATRVRGALSRLCPGKPVEQITAQLECMVCDPP